MRYKHTDIVKKYANNPLFSIVLWLVSVIILLLVAGNFSWQDIGMIIVFSGFVYITLLGILDGLVKPTE